MLPFTRVCAWLINLAEKTGGNMARNGHLAGKPRASSLFTTVVTCFSSRAVLWDLMQSHYPPVLAGAASPHQQRESVILIDFVR